MKSLNIALLFVASLGLLAYGCAKSDSGSTSSTDTTTTYTRSNTPAKSSVSVPASLSGSGSASRTANQTITSVFEERCLPLQSAASSDISIMLN